MNKMTHDEMLKYSAELVVKNNSDEAVKLLVVLQQENEILKKLYIKTCKHLFNIGNDELARYFQAQINECNVFVPQNSRGDSNSTKYKSERCQNVSITNKKEMV